MTEPLASARLKLRRAEDHMAEFNRHMADFRATDPWPVTRELERDGAEHVYRVEVRQEPPGYIGTAIGDFFDNLRSTLDSVAYDLSLAAKLAPTSSQRRNIGFPITRSAREFKKARKLLRKFIPPGALHEIEKLQPFHLWDEGWGDPPHDLWKVAEYNNIDKHRFVHPVPILPLTFIYQEPASAPAFDARFHDFGPIQAGDELARFVFADPHPDVDLHFLPSIDVSIGEGKEPANLQLERLLKFVRDDIVPRFERFF